MRHAVPTASIAGKSNDAILAAGRRRFGTPRPQVDTDALKARHNLSDLVARRVKLKKAGREFVGLCPFHDERTPSFYVVDAKGLAHCFGCGWSGDHIAYVMDAELVDFRAAAEMIAGGDLPFVEPAVRARQVARDDTESAAKRADALALWREARPAKGTPAETYLRSRGIVIPVPPSVRFAETWAWKDYDTGEVGRSLPAMVCAAQARDGKVTGVQRVFLAPDGSAKAAMDKPKLGLGDIRGSALRLGPARPHVVLCEGPEDGLSVFQCDYADDPHSSVWVVFGTGCMPLVDLPDEVRAVTLAGQNNAAGRAAVERSLTSYADQGRHVEAGYPPARFDDWNDELRGIDAPVTA